PDVTPPRIGADHWHSAIGFDICGTFAPPLADNGQDPLGIHGHGDGVVHTHPFSRQSSGQRAVLRHYLDTLEIEVTETELKLPGQDGKKNGDRCGDKEASVQVKVWDTRAPSDPGRVVTGDPASTRLGDSQLITVAFVPEDAELRRPPSEPQLDQLTDVGPTPSSTVPGAVATSIVPPVSIPDSAPPTSAP
ncbi:MAG: hypothetical protein LC733_06275, partial [Actinobacteria bacterium]|nr:hypothetical protein [Actinomycetota bacterium]